MAANSHQLELEEVLGDYAGLQRMARDFVADEQTAEDLLQQAMEHAVRNPNWQLGKLRAWLRGTLRNLSKQHFRGSARRLAREAKVSLPESGSDEAHDHADMLAAELESRELMLQAVNQLAKPYRDTIILHYMQGQSLKEIGEAMDVPVRTVETRLYRGRNQIRKHLEKRYGKESFALMILPLAFPAAEGGLTATLLATGTSAVGKGALSFFTPWRMMTLAALVVASTLLWWQPWQDRPPANPEDPEQAQASLPNPGEGQSLDGPGLSRQEQDELLASSTEDSAVSSATTQSVRLLEAGSNTPMPGLRLRATCLRAATTEEILLGAEHPQWFRPRERVWWRLGEVEATSNEAGLVTWQPPAETEVLFTYLDVHTATHSIEDYSRGRRPMVWRPGAEPYTLQMHPRQGRAQGKVVLPDGTPLADATIELTHHWILAPQLQPQRRANTAANGEFALAELANQQGGFFLIPRKEGYAPLRHLSVMRSAGFGENYEAIELVMAPEVLRQVRILDAQGQAVKDATINATPVEEQEQPEYRLGSYSGAWESSAQSNGQGMATLRGVPDQDWQVHVRMNGQLRWSGQFDAQESIVEIRLAPRRTLQLLVQDDQGQSVPNATVLVLHGEGKSRGVSNAQGLVQLSVPTEGPRVIAALAANKALTILEQPAGGAEETTLQLADALATGGRLLDWPGKSEGAFPPEVYVQEERTLLLAPELHAAASFPIGIGRVVTPRQLLDLDGTSLQADGSFAVDHLAPGQVELWAGTRFNPIAYGNYDAGTQDIRLSPGQGMSTRTAMHFQVEDALSGDPVPKFYVVLQTYEVESKTWMRLPILVAETVDGRFSLLGLKPQRYRVMVWAPAGFVTTMLTDQVFAAGEQDFLVRLHPSTSLHLELVGSDGQPLDGVEVSALSASGLPIPFSGDRVGSFANVLRSRQDGSLTLSGIPRHTTFRLRFQYRGQEVVREFQSEPIGQKLETVSLPF
jgi:RNA polymerase sigma-70 factor (ECF subfamily)